MVDNLVEISDETEEAVLCTLSNRFLNKRIYTQLGDNIIFINPNETLPIYDLSVMSLYSNRNNSDRRQNRQRSAAHIYATASKALQNIENGSQHEALIFCGESGCGKTTNFFHALRLLCADKRSRISVEQINALQQICQSFGGAKTLKNQCSTRFGCVAKLAIKSSVVSGFTVLATLPLELNRLVSQCTGDFNFGILYQLCAGLNGDERARYGIKLPQNYFYLNQGKCNIDSVEESTKLKAVCKALRVIGFSDAQRDIIFAVLSAILHTGNIFFYTQKTISNEEYAEIANENVVQWVAYLLSVDYDTLKTILVGGGSENMGKRTETKMTPPANNLKGVNAALDARDSLAKILYENLFAWILSRISLFFQDKSDSSAYTGGTITLFDMFGFEKYNNNGYEEFCVNAANETLEHFFLQRTFAPLLRQRVEESGAEGTDALAPPVLVATNRRAVELIIRRPNGIIPLLDNECKFPKSSDETFFQHCNLNHYDKSAYVKARVKDRFEFGVRHAAGTVFYNLESFIAKNRWRRPAEITRALRASRDALLVFVFNDKKPLEHRAEDAADDEVFITAGVETTTVYVAAELCENLRAFLDELKGVNCTFVRCIRSNVERQPNKFDTAAVQRQLRAFGAIDACEMLRHAFVYCFTHAQFADEMRCLLPDEVTRGRSVVETSRAVLDTQGVDGVAEARLAAVHIYVKERLWRQLLELRGFTRNVAALILQRNLRKWLAVRQFSRRQRAVIRLQAGCRAWKARKIAAEKRRRILENIQVQKAILETRQTVDPMTRQSDKVGEAEDLFSEFPEELRAQIRATEHLVSDSNVRQVTHYLPIQIGVPRPIVSVVTIEEFGEQHLKHHVLGARREPIFAPFLPKPTEREFADAIFLFKLTLRYMNDTTLSANKAMIIAKFIIQKGIDELGQRDEIYVQLCNQTYRNTSESGLTRAWTLMLIAVNAFPPGIFVFPMLYSYFQSVRPAALSNLLINGLTRPLVASNPATRSRLFAPSNFEQTAIARRQPMILNARLYDGDTVAIEADAWTTVCEFTQRVLRHKGIGDSAGWCVELCDGRRSVQIAEGQYVFDAAAQFDAPNVRAVGVGDGKTNPFIFTTVTNTTAWQRSDVSPVRHCIPERDYDNYSNGTRPLKYVSPLAPRSPYCFGELLEKGYGSNGNVARNGKSDSGNWESSEREDKFDANGGDASKLRRVEFRFAPPTSNEDKQNKQMFPRRQNPNCMSRITEEEFAMDGFRDATLTRQGKDAPRDYSALSIASRIRKISVPTGNGDVDKFLDDVFRNALPPVDYNQNERGRIADKLAASIKGGLRHGADFSHFDYVESNKDHYGCIQPIVRSPASSGVTSPLGDYAHWRGASNGSAQVGRQIVYNGRNYYGNNATDAPARRLFCDAPTDYGNVGDLRRSSADYSCRGASRVNERVLPPVEPLYGGSIAASIRLAVSPPPPPVLSRSVTADTCHNVYSNSGGEESQLYGHRGTYLSDGIEDEMVNDWVHEAELSYNDAIASIAYMGATSRVDVAASRKLSTMNGTSFVNGTATRAIIPSIKARPAVEFAREPFTITVRKEIFAVEEELYDGAQIDLIFAQIIADCRRGLSLRIRKYEREAVNQILCGHRIRPSSLDALAEIATKVKLQVIDAARKWLFYFCRLYPCVEERPNDRVSLMLGIGETGIRLISHPTDADGLESAVIQDHFEYADISELVIENQNSLRLITRQSISVLLTSVHANVIKQCIEQYINGTVVDRKFVVTTAKYATAEPNLLSFNAGEFIQLVAGADSKCPVSGNWLFGKLENRFGWFPADYARPIGEEDTVTDVDNQLHAEANRRTREALCAEFSADTILANANDAELYGGSVAANSKERHTMVEFAVRFFRHPKNFSVSAGGSDSRSRKKKDWTWKEITDKVKFVDHPILHSLLRLESADADKLAVEVFLCVMRYMGDENLKRSQTLTDCVYELLSICHRYVPLRDEVYCQIVKQLTANRSTRQSPEESQVRGWRLLSILTAYFGCSSTLKPYFVKFLSDVAHDCRRLFHGIAKQCLHHLDQSFRYGGRRFILSAAEVEATTNGKNVRRQVYYFPGGHRRVIYTRAVTVVEQIMQELCLEMNVRGADEQEEFSLCYILEKDNTMKMLNNDEYILDVVTELESREETPDYILILMRSVWIHPLREDSQLYTDALFFQIMPNYIAGLLTSLCNGNVTAATLSDVTHLGALLLLSDPLNNCVDDISANSIASLVPKTILRYGTLSAEKWAERIRAQVHKIMDHSKPSEKYTPIRARQEFLEVVSKWSLFGAGFFLVRRATTKRQNIMECVIAVNKEGVRVLTNETHESLAHYALSEIETTNKYSVSESHFIEFCLTSDAAQKHGYDVFTIETDLGPEIARVVGQYLYLSNGGHGDNEPIYILNGSVTEETTNSQ